MTGRSWQRQAGENTDHNGCGALITRISDLIHIGHGREATLLLTLKYSNLIEID